MSSADSACQLFISYSRRDPDGLAWAEKIMARLEGEGIACWKDDHDIVAGAPWPRELAGGIEQSDYLLTLLSSSSAQSDWMEEELTYARKHHKPIIPLRIDAAAEPLFGTHHLQWIDFCANEADAWARLLARLSNSSGPRRRLEIAYLQELLYRDALARVERIYTPLASEVRQQRGLHRVLPAQLMPQSFELALELTGGVARGESEAYDDALVALRKAPRLALLGEPGAGKTTTLMRIAVEKAQQALASAEAPIPLFVPLKEWLDASQPLDEFLAHHGGVLTRQWQGLLQEGRLLLLLDGLNELPTAHRPTQMAAIRRLLDDQRLHTVVVSCRRNDFVGELALKLDTLDILPLDPLRIHAFITRYCEVIDPAGSKEPGELLFWHLASGRW